MSKTVRDLKRWERFVKNAKSSTPTNLDETPDQKRKRIDYLLKHPLEFMKYYFPKYASAEFADFHKRGVKQIDKHKNEKFVLGMAIARDHAKTTFFTNMTSIYLALSGWYGPDPGTLIVSKSQENAVDLMRPIKLQFETNERLINDFGDQRSLGQWTDDKIVLKSGASWKALGKGQSPRGVKDEERRPKIIIVDDIDDDEEVLNEKRLDKSHDWLWGALYGSFDIKGAHLFMMLNNIIGTDSLMRRALYGHPEGKDFKFDYSEVVNILDKNGRPSWHQRYTLKDCMAMITKMGTRLSQREYFNNPIIEGKVFKAEWIQYKSLPSLRLFKYLIAYLDPSFSNKSTADHKALMLLGMYKGELYIIKAYCAVASIQEMVNWHYDLHKWLKERGAVCEFWMEELFWQSMLYRDFKDGKEVHGFQIGVRGDTRKKPDKGARISAMSGLFERGAVYFNADEKDSHHMKELVEQFTLFDVRENKIGKDGPDAVEGGKYILEQKVFTAEPPIVGKRVSNQLF
jgi:phage terminase large subunit-like protein